MTSSLEVSVRPYKMKKKRRPLQLYMNPMFFRKHALQHSNFSSQQNRIRLNAITYRAAKTMSTMFSPLAPSMAQTPTKHRRIALETFPIFMKKDNVDGSRFLNPLQHASQQPG
uniref:Uncharacterized protein n=1 Tax=Lotharella globosa TaxID=91324 RepID=A0A7S3YJP2_9EUKA